MGYLCEQALALSCEYVCRTGPFDHSGASFATAAEAQAAAQARYEVKRQLWLTRLLRRAAESGLDACGTGLSPKPHKASVDDALSHGHPLGSPPSCLQGGEHWHDGGTDDACRKRLALELQGYSPLMVEWQGPSPRRTLVDGADPQQPSLLNRRLRFI